MNNKNQKNEMVYIKLNKPINLDLNKLITNQEHFFLPIRKQNGKTVYEMKKGKNIIKYIPVLYFFIHILLERQYSDIDNIKNTDDKDYVKLFSRDIELFKSKNDFHFIWSILRHLRIIEMKCANEPNNYKNYANSYSFKLLNPYHNDLIVQHEIMVLIDKVGKLNKKLLHKDSINNISDLDIIPNELNKHIFNAICNINFDYAKAKSHIDNLLANGSIESSNYNSCMISINRIVNNRIILTQSQLCKRYFTSVTCMPKIVRPFIYDYDNNSLVELDYSSFNAFAVYRIINEHPLDIFNEDEKRMFNDELNLYKNLLLSNDFYLAINEMFFKSKNLSRNDIKDIVLIKWFNGKLNSNSKHKRHLDKCLPCITKILNKTKEIDYSNFSNTTMKLESQLINDIIYKKFITIHPDAILYTIFDCFLIEKKYALQLYNIMTEEGNKYFKISCKVKTNDNTIFQSQPINNTLLPNLNDSNNETVVIHTNSHPNKNDLNLVLDNIEIFKSKYDKNNWHRFDITNYSNAYLAYLIVLKEIGNIDNTIESQHYNYIEELIKHSSILGENSNLWKEFKFQCDYIYKEDLIRKYNMLK